MALFNTDSYQEVGIDWLTVTLKYDNHGGGQAVARRIMGTRCAIGLLHYVSRWTNKTQR